MNKIYLLIILLSFSVFVSCSKENYTDVNKISDKRIQEVLEGLNDSVLTNKYRDTELYIDTLAKIGTNATPHMESLLKKNSTHTATKKAIIKAYSKMGVAALSAVPVLKDVKNLNKEGLGSDAGNAIKEINRYSKCGFPNLPVETKVYYVNIPKGTTPLDDFQQGDRSDQVMKTEIIVTEKEVPVVLFLTSKDPLIWKVGTLPGVSLMGVYANGIGLTGISKEISHRVVSPGSLEQTCSAIRIYENIDPYITPYYVDRASDKYMNILALTGKKPDRFQLSRHKNRYFIGPVLNKTDKVIFSNDIPLEYYLKKRSIAYGEKGFNQLFKDGVLRNILKSDLKSWEPTLASNKEAKQQLFHALSNHNSNNEIYVVTKNTELPVGAKSRFGSSIRYIIPEGITVPYSRSRKMSVIDLNN